MRLPSDETVVRLVAGFNYVEALFWLVIAVLAWVKSRGFSPSQKNNARLAGVVFLLFGCSDLVEAHTGAWWRPWWLLAWKTTCVVVLLLCWWKHARKNAKP